MNGRRLYLIAYDIASSRRWRRVHKLLVRAGERQQFSIFLCHLPPERMRRLESAMLRALDLTDDRLMVVDLGDAETGAARLRATGSAMTAAWPVLL